MLIVAVERKNEDSNDQDSNRLADGKAKVT
jgi:hypothetical protein